jgi:AmmeMemoRadiSam system protein B
MGLRAPYFAGTWYPGTKSECIRTIKQYEEDLPPGSRGEVSSLAEAGMRGGIVPHAGWYFSGKTAYSVFYKIHAVASHRGKIPDTFFIFGMHLGPGSPNYIFLDEGFQTPLGKIEVNLKAANLLSSSFNFYEEDSRNYTPDNTIELQLPFIKYLFPEATVVTIGASPGSNAFAIGEKAAQISKELGLESRFIGSTDLTHYGPNYGFTPQGTGPKSVRWVKEENDRRIIEAFLRLDFQGVLREALASRNACCPGAACAAIAAAKSLGTEKGELVHYTTSYDIHPDSSFVGYAGVVY